MPTEEGAVLAEVTRGEHRIAQHLPGALLVELGGDRGHHPIGGEGLLHGSHVHALAFELEQVFDGVVAVDQVDHPALVGDLLAIEGELGGIGMADLDPEVRVDVAGQLALLVRAVAGVLGLDKANGPTAAARRPRDDRGDPA